VSSKDRTSVLTWREIQRLDGVLMDLIWNDYGGFLVFFAKFSVKVVNYICRGGNLRMVERLGFLIGFRELQANELTSILWFVMNTFFVYVFFTLENKLRARGKEPSHR